MRERDRRILEIVSRRPITTQAELVAALRREKIAVTQATVSRDIKRLGLVKVPNSDGAYRYQPPQAVHPSRVELESRLQRAFGEYVAEVDEGSGLIVVKTATGTANAVAEALDEAAWPDVAGTIAGDNTFLVIPRKASQRRSLLRRLRALL